MTDVGDITFPEMEINISVSAIEPEVPVPGKGNGTMIGGEHLKLILLSAMFSLSILVRLFFCYRVCQGLDKLDLVELGYGGLGADVVWF